MSRSRLNPYVSPPVPQPQRALADGRYVLVQRVAEGGTAAVFLAFDTWECQWRAVKTMLPEYARRPALRHRFEREAATMMGLSHDHIISVYDGGIDGEVAYIVMEYAEGGSVIEWIERHGPMPPRLATRVILELCEGVEAAHRQGIVHRDVKPQNLLVNRDGSCKVTDFGIAQVAEEARMTMTGTVMGTIGYMAPEQHESAKHADERADIYSIAATFYTLLKGEAANHLFMAEDNDFEGIPEPLVAIIQCGADYRREHRHQTVRELSTQLIAALNELAPDPVDTPPLIDPDLPVLEERTPPSFATVRPFEAPRAEEPPPAPRSDVPSYLDPQDALSEPSSDFDQIDIGAPPALQSTTPQSIPSHGSGWVIPSADAEHDLPSGGRHHITASGRTRAIQPYSRRKTEPLIPVTVLVSGVSILAVIGLCLLVGAMVAGTFVVNSAVESLAIQRAESFDTVHQEVFGRVTQSLEQIAERHPALQGHDDAMDLFEEFKTLRSAHGDPDAITGKAHRIHSMLDQQLLHDLRGREGIDQGGSLQAHLKDLENAKSVIGHALEDLQDADQRVDQVRQSFPGITAGGCSNVD